MKEITAIIRPKKVGATRTALENLGFPSQTALAVLGRGRQRGIAGEVGIDLPIEPQTPGRSGGMKYVPKRMLTLVVPDDKVERVVSVIIGVNQTAQIGDGKIFISPVEDAVRVRTDEKGEQAIL
jgi:nitrogen regulatory protein PII 2